MRGTDHLADELARLAAAMRAAGDTALRRELTDGIRKAAGPVPAAIRAGLRPHLPNRYADVLDADLRIDVSVRTGTDAGVTIIARPRAKQRKLARLNTGVLWHPVFADRTAPRRTWRWEAQGAPSVIPGWFTGPNKAAAPRVRAEIEAALERVNAIIWAAVHG